MNISSINATQTYAPPRPRHEPPPMTNTAELLGLSTDELRQAQQSGTTLADLASERGISSEDLIKSITPDLKAGKPADAPELSDDQLAEMAGNIAAGKRPERPQGPPPGDRAQSNLQQLADAIGVDVDTLLDGNIQDVLAQMSAVGYGSTIGKSLSGGLTVDRYA
jgi:hypothetical protein